MIDLIDWVHIINAVVVLGYTTMPTSLTFIALPKEGNIVYINPGNSFTNVEEEEFKTVFGMTQTRNKVKVLLVKEGEFTVSEVNEFYQDAKEKHRKSMWPWWRWIW